MSSPEEKIDSINPSEFKKRVKIEIDTLEALTVLGALQLALRHPGFKTKPSAKIVRRFAESLQKLIVFNAPSSEFICDAGWHQHFDR